MGYVVRNGKVEEAHKVNLTREKRKIIFKPSAKQQQIKKEIIKRQQASLKESA